jgi:hypothetical protein
VPAAAAAPHAFAAAPLPARIPKLLQAQQQQGLGQLLLHHFPAGCLAPAHPTQLLLRLLRLLQLLALQQQLLQLAVVWAPPQLLLLRVLLVV